MAERNIISYIKRIFFFVLKSFSLFRTKYVRTGVSSLHMVIMASFFNIIQRGIVVYIFFSCLTSGVGISTSISVYPSSRLIRELSSSSSAVARSSASISKYPEISDNSLLVGLTILIQQPSSMLPSLLSILLLVL